MSHPIFSKIQVYISQALADCYGLVVSPEQILLQETRREFEGDVTCVVFPFTKHAGKNPEQTGTEIGETLVKIWPEGIVGFNVVKGFLNLSIADREWLKALSQHTGIATPIPSGKKIMVEYSSPNTNKPLHLGHLRNNFLGYSIAQILKAAGHEVIMANLINDRGIHICKSMIAYLQVGNGETPSSSGLKGDHLVGKYYVTYNTLFQAEVNQLIETGLAKEEAEKQAPIYLGAQDLLRKWEAADPATIDLWKKMNGWVYEGFDSTYKTIGVSFDKTYYESDTYLLGKDIITEGLKKGIFFQKEDHSVWIDLAEEGLDQKLVLRGDGTSVYITQDIGTADLKAKDFSIDGSIYVVGNEQDYHFKVLFSILKKMGRSYANGLYHLSYGMVDLPSGKMKSREGTVVDADDLIKEMVATARARRDEVQKSKALPEEEEQDLLNAIGLGAIKYYLLKVEPSKRMLFDSEKSIDLQGNTAVAIQYAHARIQSILRAASGINGIEVALDYQLHSSEKALIKMLLDWPNVIEKAAQDYSPAQICNFIYDLTRAFGSLFAELSILKAESEEAKSNRLKLCLETGNTIAQGLKLLGISPPNRM